VHGSETKNPSFNSQKHGGIALKFAKKHNHVTAYRVRKIKRHPKYPVNKTQTHQDRTLTTRAEPSIRQRGRILTGDEGQKFEGTPILPGKNRVLGRKETFFPGRIE